MSSDTVVGNPLRETPFEAVIGLEVHVQLATRTKMFCSCRNEFGRSPNSNICPVCLGYPGALPVINRQAVEYALLVATACNCRIDPFTKFDRKNYYYPDLPKGYQISQFDEPIGQGGHVEYLLEGQRGRVELKRIHMEEDAGKNLHVDGRDVSHVDLNRAGVPLLEIVTDPVIRSPAEAGAYVRALRLILLYLGVSDCNMEEGSLRCDVNASLRPRGSTELETRTEVKNLNSFSNIENALVHELGRQLKLRSRGEAVTQETRLFDPEKGTTRPMRGKEEAHDYRYFPEPDLAPLTFDAARLEEVSNRVPELPLARYARYTDEMGLAEYHADILVRDVEAARFFDACVARGSGPKSTANWIVNSLKEEMNAQRKTPEELGLSAERFTELVKAVDEGTLSTQKGRDVFKAMLSTERSVNQRSVNQRSVAELIADLGLEQISDDSLLREAVAQAIEANPGPAQDVREGKKQSVNFLVGQVMRATQGKANPGKVSQLIAEALAE